MLRELNLEELISIEGGKSPCYDAGYSAGKAAAAGLQLYGIYCLLALL